eukprot:6273321-Amphidinium_carterae.1
MPVARAKPIDATRRQPEAATHPHWSTLQPPPPKQPSAIAKSSALNARSQTAPHGTLQAEYPLGNLKQISAPHPAAPPPTKDVRQNIRTCRSAPSRQQLLLLLQRSLQQEKKASSNPSRAKQVSTHQPAAAPAPKDVKQIMQKHSQLAAAAARRPVRPTRAQTRIQQEIAQPTPHPPPHRTPTDTSQTQDGERTPQQIDM